MTGGVFPAQLLFAHPGYVRAARGIEVPGRHQLFMHACDISRAADGAFRVNADWTQAPSGAGYALADRRVVAHAVPDLYERIGPRPASPWAQALRLALIDVAPESAEEPVVVVLSPGIHSETAFDQAYLASVLGFPMVESADLVVRDGKLWMRSLGTLKRVDVVLRRVDADYIDPLDLRADSRLGVVGLVEVLRRGAVTVVNTLGSGILESPGLLRFLPELAESLLGETPLLETAPVYWGGINVERSHLLSKLTSLLIKPVIGGDDDRRPRADREATRSACGPHRGHPVAVGRPGAAAVLLGPYRFSAQVGCPRPASACGCSRSSQRGGYAPDDRRPRLPVRSWQRRLHDEDRCSQGYLGPNANARHGRTNPDFAAGRTAVRVSCRRPSGSATPSPTRAVSSPRVLSDLFWMGRYAERAENMARLLIVTRERYHEFRHRQDMEGSECVPVLLASLGQITGTDTGADGDSHEMIATAPTTLWSLTADRHRSGSLAHSVERLGLSARAVRDQMSNDTWMVLAAVERAVLHHGRLMPESQTTGEAFLVSAHRETLAGMLALSGLAAESMVQDVGWTVMDIGRRIERGLALTALLSATLTTVRSPGAEQTVTESTLVACESSVIYRRRNLGAVSISAVADLVLLDAENPRSLVYQFERLRADLKALPGSSGSSRPERLVDELGTRLRRLDPTDLDDVDARRHTPRTRRSARRAAQRTCASCPASSPRRTCRCRAACSRCGGPTNAA